MTAHGGHGTSPRRRRRLPTLRAVALLVARGVRREAPLLVAWWAVVVIAVVVAVGSARFATDVLDDGAREAVRAAGPDADLVVTVGTTRVQTMLAYEGTGADDVELPALRGVVDHVVLAVMSGAVDVLEVSGTEPEDDLPVRYMLLTDAAAPRLRLVAGELPPPADGSPELSPTGPPAPVLVSEAHATTAGLSVGDVVELPPAPLPPGSLDPPPPPVRVEVVGIVEALDVADVAWADASALWTPPDGTEPITLLATPRTAVFLQGAMGNGIRSVARLVVNPDRFTARVAADVAGELEGLSVGAQGVLPQHLMAKSSVTTNLDDVLADYVLAARATSAQLAVPTAGAVGTVAVVLVLLARLLVDRRRTAIELERARGAAVGTVVLRLGLESFVTAAAAVAAGLALLAWLLPGRTPVAPLAAVVATALVATPLWGGALARRAWSGVREPANRRDRARLTRRRAAARLVGEGAVLALAWGATTALQRRGLLQTTTADVDPFLAAAPLLIALAAAVVALRVYPWPVRPLIALARRSPGALGVVGTSRARRALAPVPVIALTLASCVGVAGLVLIDTVRDGQLTASWLRVPADAVVTAGDVAPIALELADSPGVTGVATGDLVPEANGDLGNRETTISVLAIDAAYAAVAAQAPGSGDTTGLAALAEAWADQAALDEGADASEDADEPVPAVVDERLAARIGERGLTVAVHGQRLELRIIGTTQHSPRGIAPGPFVYIPLGAVLDDDDNPFPPTVAWVDGPAAARAADAAVGAGPATAVSRVDWLADRRSRPMVGGVEQALLVGAGVTALLAAIGMSATALAGSRERGRTLALLRTLGMRPRLGWWLALVELVPMTVTATVGGGLAGVTVVRVLGDTLGLDVLAGGPDVPPVVVDPVALGWVAGAAAAVLLVAVSADAVAHRRDRLSEVLRVGEAPGG